MRIRNEVGGGGGGGEVSSPMANFFSTFYLARIEIEQSLPFILGATIHSLYLAIYLFAH